MPYSAKSINLQNGLILIWKMLKNSLLEKTKPNLWNQILLLAYSDIFVLERSKNMPNFQNKANCTLSYI
ncbi:MAG: hypothetical protein EBU03_03345 [Methylophilaceae bacterium]|nr:hypothetical protein [Methylophilaceae bacterium]